jgi:hypothetical protein
VLEQHFGKVVRSLGIKHHYPDPGIVQGDSQIQIIHAGRLQAHADAGKRGEFLHQPLAISRGIGERLGLHRDLIAADHQNQGFGAHVDAGKAGNNYVGNNYFSFHGHHFD